MANYTAETAILGLLAFLASPQSESLVARNLKCSLQKYGMCWISAAMAISNVRLCCRVPVKEEKE